MRLLSIGFSPLSVLWKVQATRHDKRRDQQQHADADRRHPRAGGAVEDRDEHVRTPFPDLEMG